MRVTFLSLVLFFSVLEPANASVDFSVLHDPSFFRMGFSGNCTVHFKGQGKDEKFNRDAVLTIDRGEAGGVAGNYTYFSMHLFAGHPYNIANSFSIGSQPPGRDEYDYLDDLSYVDTKLFHHVEITENGFAASTMERHIRPDTGIEDRNLRFATEIQTAGLDEYRGHFEVWEKKRVSFGFGLIPTPIWKTRGYSFDCKALTLTTLKP